MDARTSDKAPQSLFDEASAQLAGKNFKDAQILLQQLRAQDLTSPAVEANLGRAYAEGGYLGFGVLHLENAVALDRFDSDARQDLALAQSKVAGGLGLPMKHPAEWGHLVGSYLKPSEAFSLATLFVLILLFLRLARPVKNQLAVALIFLAVFCAALGGAGLYGRSMAVVLNDTELRSAPLASAETLNSLKAGTYLRVIRKSGDFAEVERANSFIGWVSAKEVKQLP